jgi:hypothetical protein
MALGQAILTFPAIVAKRAPNMLERVFDIVDRLSSDIKGKIFTVKVIKRNSIAIFLIFAFESVFAAECFADIHRRVVDVIDTLRPDAKKEILVAQYTIISRSNGGAKNFRTFHMFKNAWMLPMFILRYNKNMLGRVFDVVDRLDGDTREKGLVGNDGNLALPICVFQNAQHMSERVIDTIAGLGLDAQRRAFTHVIGSRGSSFLVYALREVTSVGTVNVLGEIISGGEEKTVEKILDMTDRFSPLIQQEIFTKADGVVFLFVSLACLKYKKIS